MLVQVRLDPRVRWGTAAEPTASRPEHLPAPLVVTPAHARALRQAYRPVRLEGMHVAAVATLKRVVDNDAVADKRIDGDAWSAYLALSDAQPGRRIPWNLRLNDPAFVEALIEWLTAHGGVSAALTAVDLLLLSDAAARADPRWQSLADRVRAMHPDAAERLLLATGARR